MPGLGPRVGGAHVDVNLKFDDKSIGDVGKAIHRQLSKLNKDLAKVGEQNRKVYQAIGRDSVTAWRALLGAVMASAPLIGGAISGLSGAVTILGDAFYRTLQAGYAFLPILTSIGVAAGTAFIGLKSFFEALKSGDLSGLTPSAKAAAKAVQGLAGAWKKVRDEIQERMFRGLSDDIAKLSTTLLPALRRGLGKMADSLNGLAQDMLNYVNSSAGLRVINKFLDNSAEIFDRLSAAAVPFLDGFLRLTNALSPAAKRLADRIAEVARNFQSWTKGEGFAKRMDDMMKKAEKTAGLVIEIVVNLGRALHNVFNAVNPSTNTFLQMLVDLTQRFEDWTSSVEGQDTIAKWAENGVEVMRQFGRTMEAIFPVIAELADPRVIINFLKTVEGAFEILGQLPLDKIVNAFVRISEAIQPVSSFFLAMIIAGAAFNVLLGSLIGQLGGFFSILGRLGVGKGLALLFKPLESAGKHGKTLSGLAGILGRISGILARFAKFIPFVGWAVAFGIVIAKSEFLRDKLGELWGAVKEFGSAFAEAFGEITEALAPLEPAAKAVGSIFEWLFGVMDDVMGIIAHAAIANLIHTFQGLAGIVRGLGSIIAGVITLLTGLFTLNPDKMLEGLSSIGSGLLEVFMGAAEVIIGPVLAIFETIGSEAMAGFFNGLGSIGSAIQDFANWLVEQFMSVLGIASPSTVFMQIGVWVVQGLVQGILSMGSWVVETFSNIFSRVISMLGRLPATLLRIGVRAILVLGNAVTSNAPKVLSAVGRMVTGIIGWIGRLPGRLLRLGAQAVGRLASAVSRGVPKILAHASKIFTGVVNWIARLPGRLLGLGAQAVAKLGTAIRSGIGTLKVIARDIVESVVGIIRGLPGKLLSIGSSLLNAGKTLGGKILEGIRQGITAIGDMAGSVATSLKNGINNAIGLPKDLSFSVLGKKIGFTIPGFEKGGVAPGGLIAVGEGGPELMAPPRGSRIYSNADSKRMMALPKTMILRVGSRDFIAYLEEIADNRINAADNLAWQGV